MGSNAVKRLLAGAVLGLGLFAVGPASAALAAAQNGTTHTNSFFMPLGGASAPPSCQALVSLPAAIASDDVNGVQHGTGNKNGDWGGETYTGPATLYSLNVSDGSLGAAQYIGHVTEWDGGGQNSLTGANQTEFGETLDFHGTSVSDPSQTLHIHADIHQTTNNAGTVTASTMNISCSS